MYWYGSHLAFWQVALMWVGMVGFWVLVAWAIYALVGSASRGSTFGPGDERPAQSARNILDERLAKGEIDVDEYQRRRDVMADDGRHLEPVGGVR
jgi:putative membrane protein